MTARAEAGPVGFWLETSDDDLTPRSALERDDAVDVVVVGAGFTGLWTAYYLAGADPSLRISVLDRQLAGFGASGRNGGWCSAELPIGPAEMARRYGGEPAAAMRRALMDTVDEIGRVCEEEGTDAHFAKGGSIAVATTRAEAERLRASLEEVRSLGFAGDDYRWLEAGEAAKRIRTAGCLGASWTPHCAVLHPGRLARGLARAVERRGVRIHEGTPALAIGRRRVTTPSGTIRADVVVRALEAYTGTLPGHRRLLVPLHIRMGVTEPLPAGFWEEVGWGEREALSDGRRQYVYAQRTADDRIALGLARGRQHLGSRMPERVPRGVVPPLRRTLRRLFPGIGEARLTHVWGGFIGISRDWFPSVGFHRDRGLAWAGGYVGDGVTASNLAGRTLTDLILERDTPLVRLPWVGHRWRRWEPEPLPWLGAGLLGASAGLADLMEARTGRTSRLAGVVDRLAGR